MRTTALLAVLLLPAVGPAQVERYELGRRLKRFEAEWERQTDPAARKRALAILPKASTQFLSLNLTAAARTVDDAYWALKAAEPPAAGVRWLDALCLAPTKRLYDGVEPMAVEVRQLYDVPGERPADAVATVSDRVVRLDRLPRSVGLSRGPDGGHAGPDKDTYLPVQFRTGGGVDVWRVVYLSVYTDWSPPARPTGDTLEAATARADIYLLTGLTRGDVPETDLPAVRLARRLHDLASGKPYFTPDRAGDHTLSVPTGKDSATPCRLFVPEGLSADKPVPLVVALHGAGGSENMFFESYGAGHIVKECQKRGWLLVSPRSGLLGTPPVAAIVEKLRDRYPIDPKRVFLVGHSMGAGQAIDLVQRHPGTFAAVANLGGGGRVRDKERFATLPVYVGVGTADFALKSSRSLVKALADAGATKVTAKEYPDLEHLVIVREALPDVFGLFDGVK